MNYQIKPKIKENIMTRVAHYIVIRDGYFTLREDDDQRLPEDANDGITMPSGAALGDTDWAILSFVADPTSSAENLEYQVEVNGVELMSGQFTGGVARGLWEPFPASRLLAGNNANNFQFRVLSGYGSVRFGKVVLWFQRDI
jgi:hypothetical protein